MRYDVKKFLFVGVEADRERFFEKAQEYGIVHFVEVGPVQIKEPASDVQDNMEAIKVLRGFPTMEQEEIEEYALADGLIQKILEMKASLEKMAEEQRILRMEIARVEVFGNFSLQDVADIEKETRRKVQFYFAKEGYAERNVLPDEMVHVASEHGLEYFVAFNRKPKQFPKMVEMHIEHPLGELRKRYQEVTASIQHTDHRLKSYAKYNTFLHHALIHKMNSNNLQAAMGDVELELDGSLFAVEGWVPVTKVQGLYPLVEKLNVHVEEIAQDAKDVAPTYLENEGLARVGEDLVHIYDTPSNKDTDPSLWVLFFFSLFFAFIVGDGGYGLVFLGVALYVRYKYTLGNTGKRFTKLVAILGAACLVWGVLTASFFGISFDIDSPIRKVSVLGWLAEKKAAYLIEHKDSEWKEWVKKYSTLENVSDPKEFIKKGVEDKGHGKHYEIMKKLQDNIMFELALLIGVIHLSISLLRYANRHWSAVGWVAFLIGAYLYFPSYLNATSIVNFLFGIDSDTAGRNGMFLMLGGLAVATVTAVIQHRWFGLFESMHVIQLFADVMSYLRLYALGLAGAMLIETLYDIAGSVNFVLGALIVLLGNMANIVLGAMSGTIHGLRLNFLEWYHYCFEGGGKMYNPLRKLKID